jgi:hypothetical protein
VFDTERTGWKRLKIRGITQYACYGPFRAREKAGGPAPSPLFVWVYLAKGQNTTILVLGYGVGEKSHSTCRRQQVQFFPIGRPHCCDW